MIQKNRVAFMTGGDKKFLPLIDIFLKSIQSATNLPIIVYGFNCIPEFNYSNVTNKTIQIKQHTKKGRDTALYFAKIHASLDILKSDYDTYIWIDADCIVTKNINNLLKYTNNLLDYPLFMRYNKPDFGHWKIINGIRIDTRHGQELGNIFNIQRNNDFTVATGLYIFNQKSKPFFEEMLKINQTLIDIDSTKFIDDLALSEERLANVLMWKHNFKTHLPITWISGADKQNNELDNIKHIDKFNEILNLDKSLDIMYERETNEFPANQSKILFYHGTKNPLIMHKIYDMLYKPNKLMIVAHPDDESIFGGSLLLREYGWRVICMTNAGNEERVNDFLNAMKFVGVYSYDIFDYEDSLNKPFDKDEIIEILKEEINNNNYIKILTHNEDGEYGHIQHVSLHNIVKSVVGNDLYTFCLGETINEKLLHNKKQLLDCYTTEETALPGFISYIGQESICNKKFNIDNLFTGAIEVTNTTTNRKRFYEYVIPKLIAKNRPIYVIETGTMSIDLKKNDCSFTYIIGKLIKHYTGGKLITIDNDEKKLNKAKEITREFGDVIDYIHSDSVEYLKSMSYDEINKVDLFFFDSFDVNFKNPEPSAQHHLRELLAVYDKININTMLSVDDNWLPNTCIQLYTNDWVKTEVVNVGNKPIGKGQKFDEVLQKRGWMRNDKIDVKNDRNIFLYEHKRPKDVVIKAHTSYLGTTGYNRHAQKFFKQLNKLIDVRIRNFTVSDNFIPIKEDKEMLIEQTLWSEKENKRIRNDYPLFTSYDFTDKKVINLVLNETNHYYFYDDYKGLKIGYNVWETTEQPKEYFECIKKFDQFWVPTNWQRNCTIKQGYPADKIKVIPEAVDGNIFYPKEFDKNFYNYSDGRFKFVIFGRWDYRKSTREMIETFLNTFSKNEPVDLIVSIDNSFATDNLGTTEERLKHYGLNDERIKILHFPNRNDYIKFLQNGHVFLSCSRGEGWNLPLIEAMACGTPSLYSDWGAELEFANGRGIPVEIIGEKPAWNNKGEAFEQGFRPGNYCEPNFNDLSKKMRDVYENYSDYKTKALKESEDIRKEFSWENAAEKAYKCISELILNENNKTIFDNLNHSSITDLNFKGMREELIENNIYTKYFDIKDEDIVVDAGASIGLFTLNCLEKNIKQCYVIEPDSSVINDLKLNINKSPNNDKCIFVKKAIANKNGKIHFDISKGMGTISYAKNKHVTGMEVDAITFSKFISDNNIEKIDFFKVDIEGGEYDIFCNEDNFNFIKNHIDRIALELHIGFGHNQPLQLIKNLESLGFEVLQRSVNDMEIELDDWNIKNYYHQVFIYAQNTMDINTKKQRKVVWKTKEKKALLDNNANIYKTREWSSHGEFMKDNTDNEIMVSFINGPKVDITGEKYLDKEYKVTFFDFSNAEIVFENTINTNQWTQASRQYFTDYLISVECDGKTVYHHRYNAKGKNIYIALDSKSLGDTIAWFPYVEEFRKKHECNVICSTFWNKFFKKTYPEITFINPGTPVQNIYAQYTIGYFKKDSQYLHPKPPTSVPLQQVASDILGLKYKEIPPKLFIPDAKRIIKDKYVCIATHATAQSKYWNHKDGWKTVIAYLKKLGYRVIQLSNEKTPFGSGDYWNYDPEGVEKNIDNPPIERAMTQIKYADMVIGLSSGLSWLAWAIGTPTIVISGMTNKELEFTTNTHRIINEDVCHGCWNDSFDMLTPNDWVWCPKLKNTERIFECTKSITPKMVIDAIDDILIGFSKSSIIFNEGIEEAKIIEFTPEEYTDDEKFKSIVESFNNYLIELGLTQDLINTISEKYGYYPAEIIPKKLNKKWYLKILIEHKEAIKETDSDVQIVWHLSALNKLIKDYKTFM